MMRRALLLSLCVYLFLGSFAMADSPYTYNDLEYDLVLLQQQYPEKIIYRSIGETNYGRQIFAVRIGNGKKAILLSGAHHGREWMTSMLLMKMAATYAADIEKHPLLEYGAIWIVPMVNPDGVSIQQGDFGGIPWKDRMDIWRMNRYSFSFKRWKANGRGVDLNRQYPAGWKEVKTDVEHPSYQFYKGASPFSEPETKALARFTLSIKPAVSAAYHSTGQEIFWHYQTSGEQEKRDYCLAKAVADRTGYRLSEPDMNAVGSGFTDWLIRDFKIPAMTIEIGKERENTEVPLHEFEAEWESNRDVGWILLEEALRLREK
jgi:g-D-glutamyl-meso-diaminopimelate peptidase